MSPASILLLVATLATSACAGETAPTESAAPQQQQARALVQAFVGELKPQLQQAMAAGGPAHAIQVCARVAPQLADTLSNESGWLVRRVSLQPRNQQRAQPDDWERAVLQDFASRQAAGTPATELHHAGSDPRGRFRYLQAQATEGLCLTCHGEALAPEVRAALAEHYPDDQATGYRPGEVRGAISLIAPAP